jgi:membrane associated rhomboid family serine protease
MTRSGEIQFTSGFPRPGPALKGVLVGIFVIWLLFALSINWGPDPLAGFAIDAFAELVGDTEQVFLGQLWRLLTAAILNSPQGLGDIFFTLVGLYFLSPSLESTWGSSRYLKFLVASALVAYGLQALVVYALPPFATSRLVDDIWYGALPVVEAIAIAWAMSFKGRTVRLFMILPVTGRQLIWLVVGIGVLAVIALQGSQCGLISPFGGMLSGWLLSGNPSTLRRLYLRLKLRRHERELARVRRERSQRVAASGLRVIEGGTDSDRSSDSGPDSGPGSGPLLH